MSDVEDLIQEMQDLKALHGTLTLTEILKIFEIKALKDLTMQLSRIGNKNGR